MLTALRRFLTREPKAPVKPDPRICAKADRPTWLNSSIKLSMDSYKLTHHGPCYTRWKVLVWSRGGWERAAWGRGNLADAFDYMKELNAHRIQSKQNPDAFHWDMTCRTRKNNSP